MLLKYAITNNCKNFIYASTMSIYGKQPDMPINEEASTYPKSFYAVSKLCSEHYLRIYSKFGINTIALRLFNCYGPGQNMKNLRQGMVSIYLAQAIENKKIIVKGSSERFRDFIYIDDVVDAFIAADQLKKRAIAFFNIGTGVRTTVKDLLLNIKQNLNFNLEIELNLHLVISLEFLLIFQKQKNASNGLPE